MADLSEFLSLSDEMMVYVIDSHRPINLHNLYASNQIVVLDDGTLANDELQQAFEFLNNAEEEGDDEENDDRNDEESDDNDENPEDDDEGEADEEQDNDGDESQTDDEVDEESGKRRKSGQLSPSDVEGENKDPNIPKKRRRKAKKKDDKIESVTSKISLRKQKRRRLRECQRIVTEYYTEGTYTGMAASILLYNMATQLNRATSDLLWYSIVSLSDQYLSNKMDRNDYDEKYEFFKQQVGKFSTKVSAGGIGNGGDGDDNDSIFGDAIEGANPLVVVKGADDFNIRCADEFRLILLRHWTLWDSMYHSEYVATKLGIWKEKGRQRLTNLFVKMGFPHKECQEVYSGMHITFKKLIHEKLTAIAPKYNLDEIIYSSFYRHYGFKCTISASDAVYSLSALLDCGEEWVRKHTLGAVESIESSAVESTFTERSKGISDAQLGLQSGVGVGTKTGAAAVKIGHNFQYRVDEADNGDDEVEEMEGESRETTERRKKVKKSKKSWVHNFYIAFDALDSVNLLFHGIHLAKSLQQKLVRTSISVLDKKLINTLRTFRFGVLKEGGWGSTRGAAGGGMSGENEYELFGRSITHLYRLGSFLVAAYREFQNKQLPLVLAAQNLEAGTFLVVGVMGLSRSGNVKRNHFSAAFAKCARDAGAEILYDGFETSVLEIAAADLTNFMDELVYTSS
ncbi:hypothetical protein HK098_005597 [Nowakowskiella sp. JEL0407]|nr:hypothetical protein HK098_005597 [Nowakowskiella sp. JEL0407]